MSNTKADTAKIIADDKQKRDQRKAYSSDLTDAQWEIIDAMLVLPEGGRPRMTNMREVFNAIFYQARTGCAWKDLPHDFPPEGTVRRWFHNFRRSGQLEKINAALCRQVRVQAGRDPEPSLAIIDSQSVKSTRTAGERGYDAGKKNQRVETPHPRGCDGPVAGDCRTPGQYPGS